jgi:hypothetical protein
VLGADRPPLRFSTIFCPRSNITSELSLLLSSVNRSSWYPWPTLARREPTPYDLSAVGAKVVSHGRYVIFQMAEVAIARQMFQEILRLIAELRPQPPPALA